MTTLFPSPLVVREDGSPRSGPQLLILSRLGVAEGSLASIPEKLIVDA